jgi:hypothetical protein
MAIPLASHKAGEAPPTAVKKLGSPPVEMRKKLADHLAAQEASKTLPPVVEAGVLP